MQRTLLRFESIQEIMGGENLAVIMLTDEKRQRAISSICDESMTRQILLRVQSPGSCKNLLPETLVEMLKGQYEMMIYGVHDGQYQVVLSDSEFERSVRIRFSDAVLLSIIARYPLYIEETLMKRQCIPFDEKAKGIAIPINTMDIPRLNIAMQKAIDEENYELASKLRDEINNRTNHTK